MTSLKSVALMMLAAASVAAAQQPAPVAPAAPDTTPALRDTVVSLDRIAAVVGDQPITEFDVQQRILAMAQQPGFQPPRSADEERALRTNVLSTLIDEELLVQKAAALKIEVSDNDLNASVDRQIRSIRARFNSDAEFRAELQRAGIGSQEEYRRMLGDQLRRQELQQRVIEKMRADGKIPPVNVSESEVQEAFESNRSTLPRRPATVTFRQIVIAPKPNPAEREVARVKAESLLAEIKNGADFERVAKRESADSASREQGGDLGWNRRGVMVPEFERWMFSLRPGELSPVVETVHGFHIIRVDRVQPGEVKARHILVRPVIDSADVARARAEADTVARLWTAGTPFDTLAKKHHDYASGEETTILTPIARDSLPETYVNAFRGKHAGDIAVFQIAGIGGLPKFVVAQLASAEEGGEYTLSDLRQRVRAQLVEEGSIRRFLDNLRKETYVQVYPDVAAGDGAGSAPR